MYAADLTGARSLAEAGHIGEVATVVDVVVVCDGPVASVSLEDGGEEGQAEEEMAGAFTLAFTAGTAGLEEGEGVEEPG